MKNAVKVFEIVLTALACPLALPLIVNNQNEERG
jgi:hypothetical protein